MSDHDTIEIMSHPEDDDSTLTALSSWEEWLNITMRWAPYLLLAISAGIALFSEPSGNDRLIVAALAAIAAGWTWVTFPPLHKTTDVDQRALRIYFVGFVILGGLLMLRSPVFLVYGITGFLHGSLLRPWPVAFLGIGATSFIVHAYTVIVESTPTTWAIYLGIVTLQTVAVAGGVYGGYRISEVAENRREVLERLERATLENEGLHAQLVAQAREAGVLDERQRLAREIHDTIAQGLTGVIAQLAAIDQSWGDESEVRRRLASASDLARQSLDEARRSVQAFRPGPLSASKLPEALQDVATRWSELNAIPVRVSTSGERRNLHPDIEVTLLRTAQEGLANVAKHAAATRAGITLTFMDDSVALDVLDDGAGFDLDQAGNAASYGLAAMRQRVDSISGEMTIESAMGEGTAISVRVPTPGATDD